MALKDLFLKDTRIVVSWIKDAAKIQLVYNDIVAPIKTIVEHWPDFVVLQKYFEDEKSPNAIILPKDYPEAMDILHKLQNTYNDSPKMCFIYSDEILAKKVLSAPPEEYVVRYERRDMSLIRIVPEDTIECDEGWTVWKEYLWNIPKMTSNEVQGFRRNEIKTEDLIRFLEHDLPRYNDLGISIECDFAYSSQRAVLLNITDVKRDSVTFDVKWSVSLDSIDTDFRYFGYVLSDNTVMSGIHPELIQEYFDRIIGTHVLYNDKIAQFMDRCYQTWNPWIVGKNEELEKTHCWLLPPYHSFIRMDKLPEKGIGRPMATPFIMIGDECLSAYMVDTMLKQKYTHIREGWLRADDLRTGIGKKISEDPVREMQSFRMTPYQLIHSGSSDLISTWQDILVSNTKWVASGIKHKVARTHLDYLFSLGVPGGLMGGYEVFAAYGLFYIHDFCKVHTGISVLLLADESTADSLNGVIHGARLFERTQIAIMTYTEVSDAKTKAKPYDIVVHIEPDNDTNKPLQNEHIHEFADQARINLIFPLNYQLGMSGDKLQWYAAFLGLEHVQDTDELIRNVNVARNEPFRQAFSKNLGLNERPLKYHINSINLSGV